MGIRDWDWSDRGERERPDWDRLFTALRDGTFLGAESGVRKRGLVSVNVGWLARGGLLRLYADRLEFEPNPLERLLLARRRVIPFDDIERVERRPARASDVVANGQVPRMRLHLRGAGSLDVLPAGTTLDDWILAVGESMTWWSRRGY